MLILASGSPRRREMLENAGLSFEVIPSPAEELHDASMPLHKLCEENAKLKAMAVAKEHPDDLVIGADTLVYIDQTPLGKPHTHDQAVSMLTQLSGRTHQVCTGVCLIKGEASECFHEITEVKFKNLTSDDIANYMAQVDVMDKAGAYAIQSYRDLIIEEIRGDFNNVVGLPIDRLLSHLASYDY